MYGFEVKMVKVNILTINLSQDFSEGKVVKLTLLCLEMGQLLLAQAKQRHQLSKQVIQLSLDKLGIHLKLATLI